MQRHWVFVFLMVTLCGGSRDGIAQGVISQPGISGNTTALSVSPFGQTFQPTTSIPLSGFSLALVNVDSPSDLTLHLYASDAAGALIGQPLASAFLSAAGVASFAGSQPGTPIYIPVHFEEAFTQEPGQTLAFVIEPNPMSFYYAEGNPYGGGAMLGFPDRDLTFSTILVPEPSTAALLGLAVGIYIFGKRRDSLPERNLSE